MIKRKRRRKVRRQPEPQIRVVPSEANEARVAQEVQKAARVLQNLTAANMLDSPYLVSAIYYHDGLLDNFNADRPTADPADRIVAHVAAVLRPETKTRYIQLLRERCEPLFSELAPMGLLLPVPWEPPTGRRGAVHPFAIDLFVPEGTPVCSATRGLVILADRGWRPDDWFSTSSVRGGNAVIVFDPDNLRFLRYAHLESVKATLGLFVEPGQELGAVGHTGFNANRKGHGRHLHFEINEFRQGVVSALSNEDLESALTAALWRLPTAVSPLASPLSGLITDPQTAPE